MILPWLLLLLAVATAAQPPTVTLQLLNQSNVPTRYPYARNRLQCQNVTDMAGPPHLVAADDVVLVPVENTARCLSVTFSFTTLRTRHDLNPSSVTLQLLRHNQSGGGPAAPFWQTTRAWPDNNPHWLYDGIGVPQQTELTLRQGERSVLADAAVFDLHDARLLPPGHTVWVALWATVPRHRQQAGFRQNAFYWVTLNNDTGSSEAEAASGEFYYRDSVDLNHFGWTQWTPASHVQVPLGIESATSQLAWRVWLECEPAPPPTELPTTAPPLTTAAPPVVTTAPPVTAAAPTLEPAAQSVNATWIGGAGVSHAAWAVPLALALAGTVLVVVLYRRRLAALARNTTLRDILQRARPTTRYSTDYAPSTLYGAGDADGTMRIYTTGRELVSVSLDGSDAVGESGGGGVYSEMFNDRITNTTDDDDF